MRMMKSFKAGSWFSLVLLVLLCAILGFSILLSKGDGQYVLVLKEQRSATEYMCHQVEVGDEIEFSWIHSVEKTPWLELLKVHENQQLVLVETRFQSFGAGVPHEAEGKVYIENGYTVMTGLERSFEKYQWIHSQQAQFSIRINGQLLVSPEDLPHHQPIEMYIEKR